MDRRKSNMRTRNCFYHKQNFEKKKLIVNKLRRVVIHFLIRATWIEVLLDISLPKYFHEISPAIHRVESKLFRVLTVISQNCVIVTPNYYWKTFHISNPQKELFRMKPLTFGSKHWSGFFSSNVTSFIGIEIDSNLSPSGLNYLKINLKIFCFKLAHPKVSSSLTWVVREI